MKTFLILIWSLLASRTFAQTGWQATAIPTSGRYDDVFFINDTIGWAVGGDHKIFRTNNGGSSWQLQFSPGKYLRSVEFLTPQIGFCGSLDSSLYKTTDGGQTWTDIGSSLSPRPVGFCGLASPDSNTIYACGIWRSPAYVIRSIDKGNSWTHFNMSSFASALVDIHFTSRDTGFVIGKSIHPNEGGIILYTTTGGTNWQLVHKTNVAEDIVWKIQTPDRKNYFAAVSANPNSRNTRILKSNDGGMTWQTITIRPTFYHLQVVGFIDSLKGWAGDDDLFETTDGGLTWKTVLPAASGFNRFFRVNEGLAFLSANVVYKQKFDVITAVPPVTPDATQGHQLRIVPNPVKGITSVEAIFERNTFASIAIFSSFGSKLKQLVHARVVKGLQRFSYDFSRQAAGTYFVVMRTDEGLIYQQVLRQ